MSRYQNNFKFYQRVQTHQFTEPRRLVQNTIGSLFLLCFYRRLQKSIYQVEIFCSIKLRIMQVDLYHIEVRFTFVLLYFYYQLFLEQGKHKKVYCQ